MGVPPPTVNDVIALGTTEERERTYLYSVIELSLVVLPAQYY